MTIYRQIPRSPVFRRDHPLARGLRGLYLPGDGRALVDRGAALAHNPVSSPYGRVFSKLGVGLSRTGLSNAAAFMAGGEIRGTVFGLVRFLGTPASGQHFVCGCLDNASGNDNNFQLQIRSDGFWGIFTRCENPFDQSSFSGDAEATNDWTAVACNLNPDASSVYVDGSLAGTGGGLRGEYVSDVGRIEIGSRYNDGKTNGAPTDIEIGLLAIWGGRNLASHQHRELADDPFAIVRPRSRLITYAALAGGGGGTTTLRPRSRWR